MEKLRRNVGDATTRLQGRQARAEKHDQAQNRVDVREIFDIKVGQLPDATSSGEGHASAGFFIGAGGTAAMATKKAKKEKGKKGFNIFEEDEHREPTAEEELPKDEAGRRKIKRQYEDLLGIRIQKLRGRILNRERINKTIEGIYFICAECVKVCHNVDDGLSEDPDNVRNLCGPCSTKPVDTKNGKDAKGSKGKQAAA